MEHCRYGRPSRNEPSMLEPPCEYRPLNIPKCFYSCIYSGRFTRHKGEKFSCPCNITNIKETTNIPNIDHSSFNSFYEDLPGFSHVIGLNTQTLYNTAGCINHALLQEFKSIKDIQRPFQNSLLYRIHPTEGYCLEGAIYLTANI